MIESLLGNCTVDNGLSCHRSVFYIVGTTERMNMEVGSQKAGSRRQSDYVVRYRHEAKWY